MGGVTKSKEAQPNIEEQCQKLYSVLDSLERDLTTRNAEFVEITEEIAKIKRIIELKETEQEVQQKELDRQQKLYVLLPDAPSHLNRMKILLESNNKKMDVLQEQWLEIKNPLEEQYQDWLKHHENVSYFNFYHRLFETLYMWFTSCRAQRRSCEHPLNKR